MDNAGLDHGPFPDGVDRVRQAFEPVADADADILHAPVLDLSQHGEPELGAFPALARPQPEDVPLTAGAHPDRDIDRAVRDLPVADLDVNRVNEHHRVPPASGRFCHSTISAMTFSVIREIVSFETLAP